MPTIQAVLEFSPGEAWSDHYGIGLSSSYGNAPPCHVTHALSFYDGGGFPLNTLYRTFDPATVGIPSTASFTMHVVGMDYRSTLGEPSDMTTYMLGLTTSEAYKLRVESDLNGYLQSWYVYNYATANVWETLNSGMGNRWYGSAPTRSTGGGATYYMMFKAWQVDGPFEDYRFADNITVDFTYDDVDPPPEPDPTVTNAGMSAVRYNNIVCMASRGVASAGVSPVLVHMLWGAEKANANWQTESVATCNSDSPLGMFVEKNGRFVLSYRRGTTNYYRTNDALGRYGYWSAEASTTRSPMVLGSGRDMNSVFTCRTGASADAAM